MESASLSLANEGIADRCEGMGGDMLFHPSGGHFGLKFGKIDPALSAVVEVFEDVIADPAKDGANGRFAGLRFFVREGVAQTAPEVDGDALRY